MLPSQNNFAFNGSWPFGSSFGSRLGPTGFGLGGGATPPRPTPRVQPSAPNSATVEGIQAAANKQARDEQLADYLERFIKVSLNGNVIPPPPPPGPAPVPPGMAPGGAPSMPPGGPSMPPVGPPMPPGGPGMPPPMPGTAPMPPMPPGGPGGPPGGLPGAPGGPPKRPRARVAPVLDGLLDDKAHEVSDVNVADNMQGQLQSQGHKISADNPYNESCPECGKPAVRRCRCRIGNFGCEEGHDWYRCPEHKDRVLRGTGHGKGFGCHCEEKKEASDLPYRDRVEILPTRNGMVFGGKFKDTGSFGGFGGGIEDGETPEEAAAREFHEEAGHRVSGVRLLGIKPVTVDWNPPYSSAAQEARARQYRGSRTFYATGTLGEKDPKAKLDSSPFVEPGEYSVEQALNLTSNGHSGEYAKINEYRRKALEEIQSSMQKPSANVEKLAELLERFTVKKGQEVSPSDAKNVVIIRGNPRRAAPGTYGNIYEELSAKLQQQGFATQFDDGEPFTTPPKAYAWIGHSRGADRLRFAKDMNVPISIAIGSKQPGAFNHPDDVVDIPPDDYEKLPVKTRLAHNTLHPSQLDAITAKLRGSEVEKLAELLERFTGKDQVRALDGRFSHSAKGGPRPPAKVRVTRPESELIKKAIQKLAEMKFNLREDDHAVGEKAWNIDRFSRKDSDAYGKHKPPVKQAFTAPLYGAAGAGLGYMLGGEQGAMIGAGAGVGAGVGDNLPWLVAALHPKLRGKMLAAASKRMQSASRSSQKYLADATRSGKVSPRKSLGLRIQEHAKIPGDMYAPMMKEPSLWKAYAAGTLGGGVLGGVGTAVGLNKSGSFNKEAYGKLLQGAGKMLGSAWKAAPRAPEVVPMGLGALGGAFYGSDMTGDQGWGAGTLSGAAAGAMLANPRYNRNLLRAGTKAHWSVPAQAVQSGITGSLAGSGVDMLAGATIGADTNFGYAGAMLGTGMGAMRRGGTEALKNKAFRDSVVGKQLRPVLSKIRDADKAVSGFGTGFYQPISNTFNAAMRLPYYLQGKALPAGSMWAHQGAKNMPQALGQVAGYGSMVGTGAGMAYGGLRSSVDDMVQDNVARSYHDVKNHATNELRNALGFGHNGAMSGMTQIADQALAQFGMDPSQYSTPQKIQMLLGTVGGAAGFAGGSPLIGALGMGAAGLPLLTGGANKYNALTDPRNANQMTGKGWY